MDKKQLRDHINLIETARKTDLPKTQDLEEKGGVIDKALSAMGSRSAKGRVQWKERYDDMIGSWKEYAAETGLDTNKIFTQTEFPKAEFADFLKTQLGFDDNMVAGVKLKRGKTNIKDVFKNAAMVQAKREYQDTKMTPDEKPVSKVGPATAAPAAASAASKPAAAAAATAGAADVANAEELFKSKEIKGDLKRAVGAAKKIIGDNTLLQADDLRKVGIAYLAARGHLS